MDGLHRVGEYLDVASRTRHTHCVCGAGAEQEPEPYSPEWLAERAAAFVNEARGLVESLERYEFEHPPHDEGAPCLDMALHYAKKAVERVTTKNSSATGDAR